MRLFVGVRDEGPPRPYPATGYKASADTSGSMATLDFGGPTFTTNAATIVQTGPNSVFAALAPLADNQGSFSMRNRAPQK